MGQYDASYCTLFSHPYLVESLIRGFLPQDWTEGFDYSSLESVSEAHATDWSMRYNDRVWRLQRQDDDGWVYFYLMLEFQRTDQTFMALRILSYVGVLYQHLHKTLSLDSKDLLPLVLPVVLYNGDKPWRSATEVFELMAPAPANMAEYLPHLRFHLLDIRSLPLDELEKMRTAVACLFRLEASPDLQYSQRAILDLDGFLDRRAHESLRRDFARWLCDVLLPLRLPGVTVPDVTKLEEVQTMLTEHTLDWTAEWRMKGRQEGRRLGRQEGRREGEIALLLRQLKLKFGPLAPTVRQRVENAPAQQIVAWCERLLTVDSLADVFGD